MLFSKVLPASATVCFPIGIYTLYNCFCLARKILMSLNEWQITWEQIGGKKLRECFLNICVYSVYSFFFNLTKLVFFILPVASNVVHANRKHTLPPHLDCPHIMSRDLECCFKYSFKECKLKCFIYCFVILFLLVNKMLHEPILVCWSQIDNSILYKVSDKLFIIFRIP